MKENKLRELVEKCSEDQAYKKRFIQFPGEVLQEIGITVPEGKQIKVLENTDDLIHIVLPAGSEGELSDDALEGVSGGLIVVVA